MMLKVSLEIITQYYGSISHTLSYKKEFNVG